MTFREYLSRLITQLYRDANAVVPVSSLLDFYLVGGAARNYQTAFCHNKKLIKCPKDIDIICTNNSIHSRLREKYAFRGNFGSIGNSIKTTFKFEDKCYTLDLWYMKNPYDYVEQVYTAADGICLSFMFDTFSNLVLVKQLYSKDFLYINFLHEEYSRNYVITTRKTSELDFGLFSFKKHIQNQGILTTGSDTQISELYNTYRSINGFK